MLSRKGLNMSDEFKISLAQLNATVGDLSGNTQKVMEAWEIARDQRSDLIAFPELFITGYNPQDLILKTGNEVLDIPEGHLCCGSAGTYNILHQKMAKSLLKNKVNNIEKISPDFISTGNIGCMTQISAGTRIPIIHTVELLDWFTGGPKPYKLNNF